MTQLYVHNFHILELTNLSGYSGTQQNDVGVMTYKPLFLQRRQLGTRSPAWKFPVQGFPIGIHFLNRLAL